MTILKLWHPKDLNIRPAVRLQFSVSFKIKGSQENFQLFVEFNECYHPEPSSFVVLHYRILQNSITHTSTREQGNTKTPVPVFILSAQLLDDSVSWL